MISVEYFCINKVMSFQDQILCLFQDEEPVIKRPRIETGSDEEEEEELVSDYSVQIYIL